MPGIVHRHGRVADASDDMELIKGLRWASCESPDKALAVAHYTMDRFQLDKRRNALFSIVERLGNAGRNATSDTDKFMS